MAMIEFSDMGKQERTAWIMAGGSALIVLYLLGGYADLLRLEDGVVGNAPGLLSLCIKAAIASTLLEVAAGLVRRRRDDVVDRDERDRSIQSKATVTALTVFGLLVSVGIFWMVPIGFLGIDAVKTGTLGGALICLFTISTLARHIAEIILYRRG